MLHIRSLNTDTFKLLFENVVKYIEERGHLFKKPKELGVWETLLLEGQYDLIEKLRRVERGEGGYGTIVVPAEGFSKNKKTHNLVIGWLSEKGVNILDTRKEEAELKETLKNLNP